MSSIQKKMQEKAGFVAVGHAQATDHAKHIESQLALFKTRLEVCLIQTAEQATGLLNSKTSHAGIRVKI